MQGREIFIPKMPALKIMDLAKVLIEESAPEHGFEPGSIEIKIAGSRPGEKTHESLITNEEAAGITEDEDKFVLRYPQSPIDETNEIVDRKYDSTTATLLNRDEIKKLILEEQN